jgi:hypothetical protein
LAVGRVEHGDDLTDAVADQPIGEVPHLGRRRRRRRDRQPPGTVGTVEALQAVDDQPAPAGDHRRGDVGVP